MKGDIQMKKILSLIISVFCISACINLPIYADTATATVNIAVVSITDINDPLRIVIPRQSITVSNSGMYADSGTGYIPANSTIDVFDAILNLCARYYGTSYPQKLLIDPTGNIVKMGDSCFVLCYKNGEDIFTLPQNVEISDGDDIIVVQYGIGYQPQVAKITPSKTSDISLNEKITVNIAEYYPDPTSDVPIEGLEICDENGEYILDENGDILVTNGNGDVEISFSTPGEHYIRFVPKINYVYFDDSLDAQDDAVELLSLPDAPAILYSSSVAMPLLASVEVSETETTIEEGQVYNFADYKLESLPFYNMGCFTQDENGKTYIKGEEATAFAFFTWE